MELGSMVANTDLRLVRIFATSCIFFFTNSFGACPAPELAGF